MAVQTQRLASVLSSMKALMEECEHPATATIVIYSRHLTNPLHIPCMLDRMAAQSVLFGGIMELPTVLQSDKKLNFFLGTTLGADATTEDAGCLRLSAPAPAEFILLLPYLHTGDVSQLREEMEDVDDEVVLRAFACASYLGVSTAASDALIAIMVGRWRTLVKCSAFEPTLLPSHALDTFMHGLRESRLNFIHDPSTPVRLVLDWAARGGWGVDQRTELRALIETHCPLASVDPDLLLDFSRTYSAQLFDAVVPSSLALEAYAAKASASATAAADAEAAAKAEALVLCKHCGEYGRRNGLSRRNYPRWEHTGKYRAGYNAGWSCCDEVLKRSRGCRRIKNSEHEEAFVSPSF